MSYTPRKSSLSFRSTTSSEASRHGSTPSWTTGDRWQNPAMVTEGDDANKWTFHGERSIYETEWVKLHLADVSQPSGKRYEHHILTLKAAALIVLLDASRDRVLMGRRHRVVHDKWSWEIPGGLIEPGETAIDAASENCERRQDISPPECTRWWTLSRCSVLIRRHTTCLWRLVPGLWNSPQRKMKGVSNGYI